MMSRVSKPRAVPNVPLRAESSRVRSRVPRQFRQHRMALAVAASTDRLDRNDQLVHGRCQEVAQLAGPCLWWRPGAVQPGLVISAPVLLFSGESLNFEDAEAVPSAASACPSSCGSSFPGEAQSSNSVPQAVKWTGCDRWRLQDPQEPA